MATVAAILAIPIPLVIPGLLLGWVAALLVYRSQKSKFGEIARDSTNKNL